MKVAIGLLAVVVAVQFALILVLWDWINDNHEAVFGDNITTPKLAEKSDVKDNEERIDNLKEEIGALCRHLGVKIVKDTVKDTELVSGYTRHKYGRSAYRKEQQRWRSAYRKEQRCYRVKEHDYDDDCEGC